MSIWSKEKFKGGGLIIVPPYMFAMIGLYSKPIKRWIMNTFK